MIIKTVKIFPIQSPLIVPFRIASGAHSMLDNWGLQLTLSNKVKGVGEAAIATHITGETLSKTKHNLEGFKKHLIGKDVRNYLLLSAKAHELMPHNKAAVAALEIAMYDALTQSLDMPLWKLWGADQRIDIKSDITIVIGTVEQAAKQANDFYRKGFRSFKIKVGADFDTDIKRVLAINEKIKDSQIILDANQGFDVKTMLLFLSALKKNKVSVDLLEQPVARGNWRALQEIGQKSKVCVCADESVSNLLEAMEAIQRKAVGAINIKLMKTGIVHAVAIARWAKANKIKLMIGGMMESNIAMTAAAHIAVGLQCFDFIDLDTPYFIQGEVEKNPYLNQNGIYHLSTTKSGIGL